MPGSFSGGAGPAIALRKNDGVGVVCTTPLAQLDHANIVTIYSAEESGSVHFLIMQLVEGQRLDRLECRTG